MGNAHCELHRSRRPHLGDRAGGSRVLALMGPRPFRRQFPRFDDPEGGRVADLLHDLKKAIETGDAELWSSLHSDDFEQTELWDSSHPPSNPRKRTREEVAE